MKTETSSHIPAITDPSGLALTRGLAHLKAPLTPEAHPAAYGVGRLFQVGPHTAGLLLNLRAGGVNVIDFEMGADLVLFDAVQAIDLSCAIPLKRNAPFQHPRSGAAQVWVKYAGNVGFVPFGESLPGGRPHPHAGTGFSVGRNLGFPADLSVRRFADVPDPVSQLELQQYRYDGQRFEVQEMCMLDPCELLPEWDGWGGAMSPALADGEDLLMPFSGFRRTAGANAPKVPVVTRWQRRNGTWRPVEAHPVMDAVNCMEPSMVRDQDGALLLCARHGWPPHTADTPCLRVWRSTDGVDWQRSIDVPGVRSSGPLALHQTPWGQPVVLGNGPNAGRFMRSSISIWPLNAARDGITQATVVFDADERFGPAPAYAWNADHPLGGGVRLRDGQRHALVAIRVCENTEVVRDALPTPATGCYLETIIPQPTKG